MNNDKDDCAKIISLIIMLSALLPVLQACSGSSSDTSTGGASSSGTVVLSGQIQVAASDASSKPQAAVLGFSNKIALDSATVTVYKMSPDGTESQIATTTADSSGNYTIPDIPVANGGGGNTTDFYYEVRATSGSLDVRSPVAPSSNTTVNVNPETNLAAKIISDVASIPTSSTETPTPDLELIEATRRLVEQNADALASSITIPSVATTSATSTINFANGISASGGNAEKMFKSVQFSSEAVWLKSSGNSASSDQGSAYVKRIVREACNQPSENPLPDEAANIIGAAFIAGTTYTATQIVNAYNTASNTPVTLGTVVAAHKTLLESIDTNLDAVSTSASDFSTDQQSALYSKRGLEGASFTETSALDADQALAFLFSFAGNNCNLGNVKIVDILANLTGSTSLAAAHISDVQIYHNSGFGCDQNMLQGHFMADVKVHVPQGVSVSSITITSSDVNALGGDGTESQSANMGMGDRWSFNTNGVCVTLNGSNSVTYTVEANLSTGNQLTKMLTRNHPLVPEAIASVNGNTASKDSNAPDKVTDKRPLYSWQAPDTMLATITTAPTGSKVKYTYEFSHINTGVEKVSPLGACDKVDFGPLYEVNSFIPTVDCDPAACATAASLTATDIACRVSIQTYLVNDADDVLGQAAGNFTFFCVDSNGNGICGD